MTIAPNNPLAAKLAINRAVASGRPISPMVVKTELAKSPAGQYQQWHEIQRIVDLPVHHGMDKAELNAYNQIKVQAEALQRQFGLFPVQAEAVAAYEATGGLLAPIGVGFGKTLCTLMIAESAYRHGKKRMMLLVPPQVLYQLVQTDIKWARTRVSISYPIHIHGGRGMSDRMALAQSNRPGLYVLPYSLLSTRDTHELLEAIAPEILIADEAHNLANYSAARTRRIRDYIEQHKPQFCALSGTITSKTIKDYYHLAKWALQSGNPLPNSTTLATEWALIIDATADVSDAPVPPHAAGPLLPLVMWARRNFPGVKFPESTAGFRAAYKHRLTTCPGVVASGDSEIGTSLTLANVPVQQYEKCGGWERLKKLIDQVTQLWLTPNGDEIEHAIHTWKWLYELSAGFYNQLTWPESPVLAERKKIEIGQAEELLRRAQMHHAALQAYHRELRRWLLEDSKPGIDTPLLVGQEMAKHGAAHVGQKLYDLWRDAKGLEFEGMPERDSSAVRVCAYKINHATAWAKQLNLGDNQGGLIWVYHQEIGQWVIDALRAEGVDALHARAGEDAMILNHANAGKIIVASMRAHGVGKNLQHFQYQYFLQWPRSATQAEQTLGRTHRSGQKADELIVHLNNTSEFDVLNFAACLNDSLYIHQTTKNRQKLIYANYDPLPKVYSSAWLREKGANNKVLDQQQQAMLNERFGGQT